MQDINILEELFYSTEVWGRFGPLALVALSFILLTNRKYRPLGIFFIILQSLLAYHYLTLVAATPWYWWNTIILLLGIVICAFQMAN